MSEHESAVQAAQRILALSEAARGQLLNLAHRHLDFDQVLRVQASGDGADAGFDAGLAAARMQVAHRVSLLGASATDESEADDAEAEAGGGDAESAADPPSDVPTQYSEPDDEDDADDESSADDDSSDDSSDDDSSDDDSSDDDSSADDDDGDTGDTDEDDGVELTAALAGAGAAAVVAAVAAEELAEDEPVPGDDDGSAPGDDEDQPVPGEEPEAAEPEEPEAPAADEEAAADEVAPEDDAPAEEAPAEEAVSPGAQGDEEATVLMDRSDEEATALRSQSDDEVAAALAHLAAQGGGEGQAGDEEPSTIPAAFLGGDRKAPNLSEDTTHPGDDEATMLPPGFLDPQIKETDVAGQSSAAVRIFGTKGQAVDTKGTKHRPIPMEEAPKRYTKGMSADELGLVKEEAEYQGPKGPSITNDEDLPAQPVDTSLEENPDALPRAEVSQAQLDELTAAAEEAIQKGNLSVAADRWTDLLDLLPDHVAAYIGRGRCYLELGDYAAAMSDFQKAEDLDKSDVEPVVAMGDLYFARKEYQRAIECFDHALERESGHAMARCRRGISHYQRKNYRQAFLDLQRAYNLDPNIPNIRKYVQMAIKKLEREGKRR